MSASCMKTEHKECKIMTYLFAKFEFGQDVVDVTDPLERFFIEDFMSVVEDNLDFGSF